jgi:hypothetical protein
MKKEEGRPACLGQTLPIEDDEGRVRGIKRNPSQKLLYGCEIEVSLKFINNNLVAILIQDCTFAGSPQTLRSDITAPIGSADDIFWGSMGVKDMEIKSFGKLFADFNPTMTVATSIEKRGINAETELPRKNGNDAASDPAFGR